jgi:hypothetical protein
MVTKATGKTENTELLRTLTDNELSLIAGGGAKANASNRVSESLSLSFTQILFSY